MLLRGRLGQQPRPQQQRQSAHVRSSRSSAWRAPPQPARCSQPRRGRRALLVRANYDKFSSE